MIACIFHKGSGLGNQLARYVAVRCLALEKGYEFGVINPENFKGKDFIKLDMGIPFGSGKVNVLMSRFEEKKIVNEEGNDIREYDQTIWDVEDNTILDGEFQDERYFEDHLSEVNTWLESGELEFLDDVCIINFRGGEYAGVKDLFLPQEYWDKAISTMKKHGASIFKVVTDDVVTARKFFPNLEIVHNMEMDWKAIKYAPYLILSNSSFAILPALLNRKVREIIAPKYWAGYNKGYWQLPQNNYKKFNYIHHA
jgi:hypothetical protein